MYRPAVSLILKIILSVFLVAPTLLFATPVSASATLYDEYWLPNPDLGVSIDNGSQHQYAQTFIPELTHNVVAVEIMLRRDVDTNPCNITVTIRAVDSEGVIQLPDLCSQTMDCQSLPKDMPTAVLFAFADHPQILAGQRYAIVAYSDLQFDGVYFVGQYHDQLSDPDNYLKGNAVFSNDGGSLWFNYLSEDFHFRVFGTEDLGYDFGDAPDPTYPTLLASNGARHGINPNICLGDTIDNETDGQPDITATGDDLNDLDDEDGVTISTPWYRNTNLTVNVKLHAIGFSYGYLTAWIDKNQDGVWENNDERVFYRVWLEPGDNPLTLNLFNTSLGTTYARFRLSPGSQEELTPTGLSSGGEVEDYSLEIMDLPQADLAISVTGLPEYTKTGSEFTYQITATNNGPGDATGVEVSDLLLPEATLKSFNSDAGSFDPNTGTWSGFGLLHNQSAHLSLTVIVNAPSSGSTVYYGMEIEGAVMDPVSNNNYYEGTVSFGRPQGVGGEVTEPDRLRLILPWLALTAALLLAGTILVLRHTRK